MYIITEVEPQRFIVHVRTNNWIWKRWIKLNGEHQYYDLKHADEAGKEKETYYKRMRFLPRQRYHSVADRQRRTHADIMRSIFEAQARADVLSNEPKPGAIRPFGDERIPMYTNL
jgi:hypothetical protein